MNKVTKRDYYGMLLDIEEVKQNKELVEFIEAQIAILERKAEKAKERAAAKKTEPDELRDAVYAQLNDTDYLPIKDIVTAVEANTDIAEITNAKVVARLTQLINNGLAEKTNIKVDKTKCVGYKRV